ncbi:MAG: HAD family phosphatase [Candidatus Aenigmarchaeota archaeon]|nr:HAD family phosphatase [Candidatus Aenigmarchaeota archaeon]
MIKAVIFDMDGVLSDTVEFQIKAETDAFREFGIEISPEKILEYNGVSDGEFFSSVFKKFGSAGNPETARELKWNSLTSFAKGKIRPISGVVELVEKMKNSQLTLGVASASRKDFIELVLRELGIEKHFSAVTSSDEVSSGKPDPAVFLLTARKMGVHPEDCVVIEDAPKGVRAAKLAKMKCIAITTTHSAEELGDADKIIKSFGELTAETIKKL